VCNKKNLFEREYSKIKCVSVIKKKRIHNFGFNNCSFVINLYSKIILFFFAFFLTQSEDHGGNKVICRFDDGFLKPN